MRPATPDAVSRLLCAAHGDDRELDTALLQLGVFPPLDLSIIRSWLTLDAIGLRATTNRDGHRVVEILVERRVVARIHPDGHVVDAGAVVAAGGLAVGAR